MGAYMHIVQKNRKEIHNAETEKYVSYRRSAPVRKQLRHGKTAAFRC